jgi:hypothetical protein
MSVASREENFTISIMKYYLERKQLIKTSKNLENPGPSYQKIGGAAHQNAA